MVPVEVFEAQVTPAGWDFRCRLCSTTTTNKWATRDHVNSGPHQYKLKQWREEVPSRGFVIDSQMGPMTSQQVFVPPQGAQPQQQQQQPPTPPQQQPQVQRQQRPPPQAQPPPAETEDGPRLPDLPLAHPPPEVVRQA